MPGRVLLVGCVALLLSSVPARAGGITGMTVSGPVVGNSNQTGLITVSVSCDSWAPIRVFTGSGLGGPVWIYNTAAADECGSIQATFFGQYEVEAPTQYPVYACVVAWNGFCAGTPTSVNVTVNPPTYTQTVVPIAGSSTSTVRISRSPGPRTNPYPTYITYGIGDPACQQHTLTMLFSAFQVPSSWLPSTGSVPVYYCGPTWAFGAGAPVGFAIAQVQAPPPLPALRVRAAVGDGTLGPAAGASLPAQATVPLGGELRLEVIDSTGAAVPVALVLNPSTVAPGLAPTALFPTRVLIPYTPTATNTGRFLAVHKGTGSIAILPLNPAVPSGVLNITVGDPRALGTNHPEVDSEIFTAAHRSGIPPQFIKAHAEQESSNRFNRRAYRYEPLNTVVGDLNISRGRNLRTTSPYKTYRLETQADTLNNPGLAAGADPEPGLRERYLIGCDDRGNGGRPITADDRFVAADEIVRCSDVALGMNWESNAGDAGFTRVESMFYDPFTAQTGLAASYGLLQMMYVTAIDLQWPGDADLNRKPSVLLDIPENLARRGGSLYAGTDKVSRDFTNVTRGAVLNAPLTPETLLAAFRRAWTLYNRRKRNYAAEVAAKVPHYPVLPLVLPVLGGGQ